MMDNIRRNNVDELNMPEHEQQQQQYKLFSNSGHDGVTCEGPFNVKEVGEDEDFRKGLNKLDTVTTVPQLQQKFNKFNIIDEAAINTNTITSSKTCVAAAAKLTTTTTSTSSSSSSSIKHKTLTQNTALAKFNRIIDNTVPVTNTYNYQQHVAETLAKNSQQNQHPHNQQEHQELQEMPILSDSLKRRLATKHHHQYYSNINNISKQTSTDLIVNNSKINFSSSTAATAAAQTSSAAVAAAKTDDATTLFKQLDAEASTSKAVAAKGLTMLSSTASATSSQQEQEPETVTTATSAIQKQIGRKSLVEEDEQMERNDVHYLLKQLNSFSDIEEIEIVDMKQKQRQLQEQQQQQQQQPDYIREKHFVKADNQQQQQQQLDMSYDASESDEQHVEALKQQHVDESKHIQHVSSEQMLSELHVADTLEQQQAQNFVDVGLPMYTSESKQQHYHSATSPTATSLVIYSPSSQSHKGIRRYASQDEQNAEASYHHYQQQQQQLQHSHHYPYHQPLQQQHPYPPHHHHYLHHQPHYVHLPSEHCSEESMLQYAAAQAAAASASADPLSLQQFMDDYIFQSCHYLETNNFVANYRTAMVESSSHEFRPSTTTNTTRTSNEEFYEEEEAGYVEDHSSAHSFELHETEPPSVICKTPAPAPLTASKRQLYVEEEQQQQQQHEFAMETRLCSSGVQTDLTASSLAQSFSLSSSSSSSEKQKRRQPLFKCCYTPLDRWREKRSQQSQIQKRTKSATNTNATTTTTTTVKFADKHIEYHAPQDPPHQEHQTQQFQQISTKNTRVALIGDPSSSAVCTTTIVNSSMATSTATLVVQPQTQLPHHPQFHIHHHHSPHHSHQTQSKNNNNKNIKNNAPYAV